MDVHLQKAGIEKIDASGKKVDFHSFRYTFATKLARKGVSQRLTQELMRHSDPRLTANLYTDVSHLPTFDAVQDLDWVKDEDDSKGKTNSETRPQIRPQTVVSEGHFVSFSDTEQMTLGYAVNPYIIKKNKTSEEVLHKVLNGTQNRSRTCTPCGT